MRLDFALLADMANVDAAGKFNIIGEFNLIWSPNLPTVPIDIALAARLVAEASEGAEHKVAVALVDADGQSLARTPDVVTKFRQSVPGTTGDLRAQLVLGMGGVRLPKFGAFSFHVLVDGRFIGEREFYVAQLQPPRPPTNAPS